MSLSTSPAVPRPTPAPGVFRSLAPRVSRAPVPAPATRLTRLLAGAATVLALVCAGTASAQSACPSLLDHRVVDLFDNRVDLCDLRGKVVVAVNTASQCGYTPQYDGLEKLYRRYKDRGLVIIGFPANDFGRQEPGSNKQIAEFCQANYGVSFPMFAKTSVVGREAHPLFADLAKRSGQPPGWNFHKYVVDRRGDKVTSFPSSVEPADRRLVSLVERLLAEAPPAR